MTLPLLHKFHLIDPGKFHTPAHPHKLKYSQNSCYSNSMKLSLLKHILSITKNIIPANCKSQITQVIYFIHQAYNVKGQMLNNQ